MSTKMASLLTCVALLVGASLVATPVEAGVDIDFGASVRIGDDTDLYLAISSRYFDHDRPTVERYAVRYPNPDDLAVSFYLARRSGRSPDFIFELRRKGFSWWDISLRLGLPVDIWFVETRYAPTPPYGKAYGHWKKHKRNTVPAFVLTDDDARNLVALRVIHEYYGVPVEMAMEWRSSGRNLRAIMADEYGKRRGRPTARPSKHAGNKHHGKGRGKNKR